MSAINDEMVWLILSIMMTGLMWLPYIVNRLLEQGIGNALWDPRGDTHTNRPWAGRMMHAHQNAVENLVIFAPLVLLLPHYEISTALTLFACKLYFFSRLLHFLVFSFGVPVLRVVSFLGGVGAQLILGITLLTH